MPVSTSVCPKVMILRRYNCLILLQISGEFHHGECLGAAHVSGRSLLEGGHALHSRQTAAKTRAGSGTGKITPLFCVRFIF